jgi:sugar/nucleoside kinase (ribokinase family)
MRRSSGLKCLAVGAVGDDEKADFVIATLQKFGIDASAMQRLKGIPTSATILNVRPERRPPGFARPRRLGPFRRGAGDL